MESKKNKRVEIRLSGFGGQGIITAGVILGRAAAVNEGRNAVMAQSYGPESRGGASAAEVLIDDGEIDYPHVVQPDAIMVLSQEAYTKYGIGRPNGALLIVERDLVEIDEEAEKGKIVMQVPFTALAEKVGRRLVLNMVALGFLCRATGAVSAEALKQAIAASVPPGSEKINLQAFETGYQYMDGLRMANQETA
jgi:2-oxoglutarate ferredoxin oxidoreductase subunit gamma